MPMKNNKILLHLVQHGINSDVYKPIDKNDEAYKNILKTFFNNQVYDYVVFFNSRNMNRKRLSNVILGYRVFCDSLTKEEAKRCLLLMHTEPVLDAGTDVPATLEALCPMYPTKLIPNAFLPQDMNVLYNIADVTINVTSNEGFGLSCAESIMAGTPVIVNVTGGLQDQIGQTTDDGSPIEFTKEFGSNHKGRYKKFGKWAFPIISKGKYIQGSVPTPYICDDICNVEDIADAMMYWYLSGNDMREECGAEGRRWAMNEGNINSKHMAEEFIRAMDFTLENFEPRKPFDIHTSDEYIGHQMPDDKIGMEFGQVNIENIKNKIEQTKNNNYFHL